MDNSKQLIAKLKTVQLIGKDIINTNCSILEIAEAPDPLSDRIIYGCEELSNTLPCPICLFDEGAIQLYGAIDPLITLIEVLHGQSSE